MDDIFDFIQLPIVRNVKAKTIASEIDGISSDEIGKKLKAMMDKIGYELSIIGDGPFARLINKNLLNKK